MSNNTDYHTSIFTYFIYCFTLPSPYYHFTAFVLVNVPFVLPLCLYILRLGLQRWRSGAKISHTDFFTYNMVVVQLLTISGACILNLNWIFRSDVVVMVSLYMILVTYAAVIIFQILTCLERYMAVVHPVTYLRMKSQTWTLIRNISCGFVWLQCVIMSIYFSQMRDYIAYFSINLLGYSLCLLIVLLCNLCVLRALLRPRPGDGAKGSKSKQKALYMITAITGTLLLKFGGDLFSTGSFLILAKDSDSSQENYGLSCTFYFSLIWFTLPSSLVLPLLFLHRNDKLLCCKTKK